MAGRRPPVRPPLPARVRARLTSPHIVPIHRYGEIDGRLYLDMQLVDGTDLGGLIAGGPLPPARACDLISQVARALDVAHRKGLVHRDVKPSNILVTRDDHVYLIDFGIARSADVTQTSQTGALMGSVAYMAPERFAGEGDHRVDIYALGCVLYETLTGRPAFSGTDPLVVLNAHQNGPRPRPTAARQGLAAAWDTVVDRALARDPGQRFPTAGELAAAARAVLTAPIPAPIPGPVTAVDPLLQAPQPQASHPQAPGYPQPGYPPTGYPQPGYPQPGHPPSWYLAGSPPVEPPPPRRRGRGGAVIGALVAVLVVAAAVVTTAVVNGRLAIIAGDKDHSLRLWDAATHGLS